jgi:hypothetical protein
MKSLNDQIVFLVNGIDGQGTLCNGAQPDGTRAGPVAFIQREKAAEVAKKANGYIVEILLSVLIGHCLNAGTTLFIDKGDQLVIHPDTIAYLTEQRVEINLLGVGEPL